MQFRNFLHALLALAMLIPLGLAALGSITTAAQAQTVTPNVPSGQPVRTTVSLTIDGGPGASRYRLSIGRSGEPIRLMTDYQKSNVINWTPIDEGAYFLVGQVLYDDETQAFAVTAFNIGTVIGAPLPGPIVMPTENPLLGFYSAPPCPVGAEMRVRFSSGVAITSTVTHAKPCQNGASMNFYLAGMRENTTYFVGYELRNAQTKQTLGFGPLQPFQTGAIAAPVASASLMTGPAGNSSFAEKVVLHSPVIGDAPAILPMPYAVDIAGETIWYTDKLAGGTLMRPIGNGRFLYVSDSEDGFRTLVEFDLAGNIVRSVSIDALNRQLTALGEDVISDLHHDARPLPNGRIAVIGTVERLLTDVQDPGEVDVLGDAILVLDENLQVEWVWNAFDHLDVTRKAIIGETCQEGSGGRGCFQFFLAESANDWTHSNTVTYHAADGNLLVSVRHQDWIVKIDYRDGAGDGHIIWRLGNDGDFGIQSAFPFPFPWFSHQHDPNFATSSALVVYDNSNIRCVMSGSLCNARGRVYELDENNMVATLVHDVDLGVESLAVGSSHTLSNGNFFFSSGLADGDLAHRTVVHETSPPGQILHELDQTTSAYRSHRLPDLYTGLPDLSGN